MSYYRYYDSPDGQDLLLKTDYVCRKLAYTSSVHALADVFLGTTPKTYWGMAERFFRVFTPPVAAGAVFTTTVYISTKLRKKDDGFNHVFGGISAAYFLARWVGNKNFVWFFCAPVCAGLYLYKDMKLRGAQIQPDQTDAMYNMGNVVNEYDFYRPTIYSKPSYITSDEFN